MTNNKILRFLFLILILVSFNCKKNSISESEKKLIGEIFFYNDDVVMFEKPEASPILKKFVKTDSVKILETKITDIKNPQSMYYKVYFGEQFGYIPIISEIKKNMFAFLYAHPDTKAKIKASSLRIRETPDLNGKVITAIPKSEIVEILWEGQLFEKIDLKYDTWMKIKTKEGKTGFSYAGYMTKNLEENLDPNFISFDDNSELISGYIELKEFPVYFTSYNVEVKKGDQSSCGEVDLKAFPKQEEIHQVQAIAKVKDEKFYLVEGFNEDHGCYNGYKAWISEKQVTFVEDIFKYTSEKYGQNFDKKFLEDINKSYNGKLNVKTLTIEDFPIQVKEKYKFFKVNNRDIFYLKKGEYYYAEGVYGITENKIEDVDQDGNEELVNPYGYICVCMCVSPPVSLKVWTGSGFKEIYLNNPMNKIELEFKDKLVIENLTEYDGDPYSSDPNRKPKLTTNYYEIKNFELVPTKKRPKKV